MMWVRTLATEEWGAAVVGPGTEGQQGRQGGYPQKPSLAHGIQEKGPE